MNLTPEIFYEIEIKAVMNKDKYEELDRLLKSDSRFKMINKESINTEFYKADNDKIDVRLRYSDKSMEIVCKKGLVTKNVRKEIKIPLPTIEHINHFRQIFDLLPVVSNPQTLKHKQEFLYNYGGYDYIICLQHIENFAYLLEVEFLSKTDNSAIHEKNLLDILKEFGLDVIDNEKFLIRVEDYKAGKVTINYPV